jgi:hypothetical protein
MIHVICLSFYYLTYVLVYLKRGVNPLSCLLLLVMDYVLSRHFSNRITTNGFSSIRESSLLSFSSFLFPLLLPPYTPAFTPPKILSREKDISGSYHSQSFNNNRVLYVSYYCTTTPLDFDGLNDIHDSFSNTSSPQ